MPGWFKKTERVTAATARRVTGISIGPLGGLQWSDPGPSQRELVRRFLTALEDRRVLYNPMQLEVRVRWTIRSIRFAASARRHCSISVNRILE